MIPLWSQSLEHKVEKETQTLPPISPHLLSPGGIPCLPENHKITSITSDLSR